MDQSLFVGEMGHRPSSGEIQQSGPDLSLDRHTRVIAKEKAALEYSERLERISDMLKESSVNPESTSLGPWLSVFGKLPSTNLCFLRVLT